MATVLSRFTTGGGTFDISIIEIDEVDGEKPSKFWQPTVIRTGGEDFDTRLINYLVDEFKKDQGIDLRNDPLAMQRLKEAAEKAKIELFRSADRRESAVHYCRRDRS